MTMPTNLFAEVFDFVLFSVFVKKIGKIGFLKRVETGLFHVFLKDTLRRF